MLTKQISIIDISILPPIYWLRSLHRSIIQYNMVIGHSSTNYSLATPAEGYTITSLYTDCDTILDSPKIPFLQCRTEAKHAYSFAKAACLAFPRVSIVELELEVKGHVHIISIMSVGVGLGMQTHSIFRFPINTQFRSQADRLPWMRWLYPRRMSTTRRRM